MLESKRWRLLLILFAITAFAALGFAACGDDEEEGPPEIGTVDVLGIWGDDEAVSFEAMVAPWKTTTGGEMAFTGTRDITTVLTTRVEGGNPPDVAIPAEVGRFQQFAGEGELIPLSACEGLEDTIRANYPQGFIDLGTVDGTLYGFFMKADTKGTIWYNPQFFADNGYEPLTAASTWDDLIALTDQILADGTPPWSVGVESAEASGWPGSDWIQQILLNEAGGAVYDGVIDGSIPLTDPQVKDAWEKFGQIALTEGYTVQEGAVGINATNFVDSTYPPFESPPEAAMVYLGGFASGFITEQFPDAVPVEDFDFFPFPGGGVTGAANIVYAFNDDATTCSFLNHLASAEAQQIWVERGGFTSVNSQVGLDAYPDPIARAQAEQLSGAELFRFDLDDAIGGALQLAFFDGVTQYLANPGNLDSILSNIEAARE
jgi:alpha-glucoside transport system substrate-binding protein